MEVVRSFYAYLNQNDWDGIASLTTPDFAWHTASGIAATRIWRGVEAARDWWNSEVAESWDLAKSRDEIEEVFDADPFVVVAVRSLDFGRRSGVPVESRIAALFELRRGKIARLQVYRNLRDARDAAKRGPQG